MKENESISVPALFDTEKEYKRIFKQHPDSHLNQAKSIQEIHKLVPELKLLDAPELMRLLDRKSVV